MGQSYGGTTDRSSRFAARSKGPDAHEAEGRIVERSLEEYQEGEGAANIETPDDDEPQPWHESFKSREGIGEMLDDLPDSESSNSADSSETLSDSYEQFFDRMDEMSAAADEAIEAQTAALGRSQEEREAARPYNNDDIRRDKTGVSGTEQGRRNAEEHRIRRGTDVAGPHSVPWNREGQEAPQNRTLEQQESIEADAAELNDISEQAHQGIDHSERATAVRTTTPARTNPADDVLDSITLENPLDDSTYEVSVDTESDWTSKLGESHGEETVSEVAALSYQITESFPDTATETDLDPAQFTTGPNQEAIAQSISTLVDEQGQLPQQAAFNVIDSLQYDEQTRHALDESVLDPRDMLDEQQRDRAQNATESLQETYPDLADRDSDQLEQSIARKMANGADVLSARDGTVRAAAENDTFTWPIEEIDPESQHRVSVEGTVEELYDPNDSGQHQAGIIKDTTDIRTAENHMKFTWFKSSGVGGKISDLSAEGEDVVGTSGEVKISGSRDYLREGDHVRFVRGTTDLYKDQKQLAVRGITDIQILEEGDGPVMYEGIGEPPEDTLSPQNLDALATDEDEISPDDFDDAQSYMDALAPDPEEQHPEAADAVTTARDVVPTDDAPAGLDTRSNVERVEADGESQFEITTDQRGEAPSNPWRAQEQRERRRDRRQRRKTEAQSEEYRRRSLERWDVPEEAIDQVIEDERREQTEQEVRQTMSYQRNESRTMYGYDSSQVHLDLPTSDERHE